MIEIARHSPSSLNLFCASPAMYVMERVLGRRQPANAKMHRGAAVEWGVVAGLTDLSLDMTECVRIAHEKYLSLCAYCTDPRVGEVARDIDRLVMRALSELRPYGTPTTTQGYTEWKPEGLRLPIVGYHDFWWDQHGICVDLKTTGALPSMIKPAHARQVALYTAGNVEGRLAYVTATKSAVYRLESPLEHRNALYRIALACERFLSLSGDPAELVALTVPDLDSFYFAPPEARQLAYSIWGV
jgi:hypothetical protein